MPHLLMCPSRGQHFICFPLICQCATNNWTCCCLSLVAAQQGGGVIHILTVVKGFSEIHKNNKTPQNIDILCWGGQIQFLKRKYCTNAFEGIFHQVKDGQTGWS